ncbi:MAG: peptidylprolyl isomerase [Dehalococcoidia bacterium]
MAKKRKRELHHLRQESSRRKNYQLGNTNPSEFYKPGFPMNIFGNVRIFAIIGVVAGVAMVGTAFLTNRARNANDNSNVDLATETPAASVTVDGSATAVPSVTPKTFSAAEQVVDPAKKYVATIKTSKGDIVIDLFADKAPKTVNSFVFLAQQGYFDGITFHRVVKDFVIQAGDPTGSGTGGPGYSTADEPNEISNTRGTLSMAKVSGATEFGSQFFINLKNNTALDYNNPSANKFYPFAEVTSGMDVVDAIGASPVGANDKPNPPIVIESVTVEEK